MGIGSIIANLVEMQCNIEESVGEASRVLRWTHNLSRHGERRMFKSCELESCDLEGWIDDANSRNGCLFWMRENS